MPSRSQKTNVDPGAFPFPIREGHDESRYLTWIRNHSNYMAVRGLPDYARAIGVLVRGVTINFLVLLPLLLVGSVAVAAYSYPEHRALAWMPLLVVAAIYLGIKLGPRAFTVRGLGVFLLAVPLAGLFIGSYRYWTESGYPLTATVLLFAVGWSLLFAVGTPLFKLRRYAATVTTGSDSSVKSRDVYERSYGGFVLVIFAVFAFESIAHFLPFFHHEIRGRTLGLPALGSITAISLGVFGSVQKILSALGNLGRKVALLVVGLLGVGVPLLILLFLADFMRFGRPIGGLGWMMFVGLLMPLGLLVVLFLGRRALSWRDRIWALMLVIVSGVLTVAVGSVTVPFLGLGDVATARFQVDIAPMLRADPSGLRDVATTLAGRGDSKLTQLSEYLEEDAAETLALKDRQILEPLLFDSAEVELVASFVEDISTSEDSALSLAAKLMAPSADGGALQVFQTFGSTSAACPRLRFYERMGLFEVTKLNSAVVAVLDRLPAVLDSLPFIQQFAATMRRDKIPRDIAVFGCRLVEVNMEIAAAAVHAQSAVPEIYASDPAVTIRGYSLRENARRIVSLALLLAFIAWLTVDINLTSIHGLYRDRLASAFLVGVDSEGDVDIEEDLDLHQICRYEAWSTAPYHLINVALNLQGSSDIGVRDRKSDYFIFSKRFIGGERTGYCRSESMEQVFPQMDLATAMAISAGAASPNMGRATNPALVALMALLNIRLGYWLPNPGIVEHRLVGNGRVDQEKAPGYAFDDAERSSSGMRETVFAEELKEIKRRRENVDESTCDMLAPSSDPPYCKPSVSYGLVGLGFSGGGIRSATLNLGITQALHQRGVFQRVDYMSTVSGGGYLGASVSALMRHKTPTSAEIAGIVNIDKTAEHVVVTVTPDEVGRAREYKYDRDTGLAVTHRQSVVAGQRLIEMESTPIQEKATFGQFFSWRVRPTHLLREMIGKLDETGRWVNVSDGGHIENLATIELLRRRCKYIITGDGEADPKHYFKGLATLVRSARIDLGVHIDIKLDSLRLNKDGYSGSHWAIGRVIYPGEKTAGHLLYLKSSVTGDEDEVIREYRHNSEAFPHESTADQFFSEGQFEAYRSLGQHIGEKVLQYAPDGALSYADLETWFSSLCDLAHAPRDARTMIARRNVSKA